MTTLASHSIVCDSQCERPLETKCQQRLGWNLHGLAAGQDLCSRTRSRSSRRTNRSSLPSTGNRPDNRAEQRAAADILAGPLVFAEAVLPFAWHRSRIRSYRIALSTYRNRLEIYH